MRQVTDVVLFAPRYFIEAASVVAGIITDSHLLKSEKSVTKAARRNVGAIFRLFLSRQDCDAFLGDLEERYRLVHGQFGRYRANVWFWKQTLASLGPIGLAWAKRLSLKPVVALIGWALAKGLVGHDSWLAAVVELWKKVRS
jgi:hypothetical protein